MSADLATRPDTEVRIADVIVGDRARKDYGDLTSLMESIREHGLLQPIGVLPGDRLLFGGRRLEACRLLGWESIPFVQPQDQEDALALLKVERDENTCRKDMTLTELVAIGRRVEELERPVARKNQLAGLRVGDQPAEPRSDQPRGTGDRAENETRRKVGDALGISGATYERAKKVLDATTDQTAPEDVRKVAEEAAREMDATGKAWGPSQKVKAAQRAASETPSQERKRPGPKPTRHVIKAANIRRILGKVSGYDEALEDVTEIDPALTSEEAAHITGDLSKSIAALQRLNRLIKERIK